MKKNKGTEERNEEKEEEREEVLSKLHHIINAIELAGMRIIKYRKEISGCP
jgi:hypothetical protein